MTCIPVTTTGERTSPNMACKISSRAAHCTRIRVLERPGALYVRESASEKESTEGASRAPCSTLNASRRTRDQPNIQHALYPIKYPFVRDGIA